VVALGAGLYLGSGVRPRQVAAPRALTTPAATETAAAPSAAPQDMQRVRSSPTPSAPRAAERQYAVKDNVTEQVRERGVPAEGASNAAAPAPAPRPAARMVGPYAVSGPPLTLDSARALIDTDPYAVPDLPVRAIYRARMIGYSAVVVVEQGLDSSTAIDVITGRNSLPAFDAVVVTGVARPDSVSRSERARVEKARADSLAAERRPEAKAAPARGAFADRAAAALVVEVRGPLSADSLAALKRRLEPLRP